LITALMSSVTTHDAIVPTKKDSAIPIPPPLRNP
jgi:hypothetical protein